MSAEPSAASRSTGSRDAVAGPVAEPPGSAPSCWRAPRRRRRFRARSPRSAGTPKVAAISAAAGVVLPMPMSPRSSRSAPAAISSAATAAPTLSARLDLGHGAARPRGGSAPEDRRICGRGTSAGRPVPSASTAMSSTRTRHPVLAASTLTPATPADEGAHHRGRHLTRVGETPGTRCHPVIAGQHHRRTRSRRRRRAAALAGRHPGAEFLEPAQGTGGLGQRRDLPGGVCARTPRAGRPDRHVSRRAPASAATRRPGRSVTRPTSSANTTPSTVHRVERAQEAGGRGTRTARWPGRCSGTSL